MKASKERAIALAALFQAAHLVDKLATQGQVPVSAFELMRHSLFRFDVDDVETIYLDHQHLPANGIRQNLSIGIRICEDIFQKGQSMDYGNTLRYAMAIIQLTKEFKRNSELQQRIREALMSMQEDNALISALYLETLATLSFRIQVLGKMQHLQNIDNEQQIRTLLFAALRAALLWQQHGGRRWHFIFRKTLILADLRTLSA